jgi:hypothetical protein
MRSVRVLLTVLLRRRPCGGGTSTCHAAAASRWHTHQVDEELLRLAVRECVLHSEPRHLNDDHLTRGGVCARLNTR